MLCLFVSVKFAHCVLRLVLKRAGWTCIDPPPCSIDADLADSRQRLHRAPPAPGTRPCYLAAVLAAVVAATTYMAGCTGGSIPHIERSARPSVHVR